jgi:phage tail sheath gpL-like
MASINLSITSERVNQTTLVKSGQARGNVQRVTDLLQALVHGAAQGDVVVTVGSSDPVAASQTITCAQADATANDTISLLGQTLTAKASGANGTTQFDIGASNSEMATNLAACINANTTLTKYAVASASSAVVTVTLRYRGALGNLMRITSVTVGGGTPFTLSGSGYFTSGAGDDSGSVSTLSRS